MIKMFTRALIAQVVPSSRGFALGLAILAIEGCDNLSTAERELVHTDAEVFETVARAERTVGADSVRLPHFLRIDSRPAENTDLLSPQTPPQAGIALDDSIPPSSAALDRIAQERRAILERLGVEEGGPFFFPGCEGIRTGEPAHKSGAAPVGARCPAEWRRYTTVGLPRRGVAQIPEKVRRTDPRPFDRGEVWTVFVTETSIGPGGQDWKQYAWVLTREPGNADLSLTARFLLSWAE
jgi:hypothetical protein